MGPDVSSSVLCSQELLIGPYAEADESSLYPSHHIILRPVLILSSHLHVCRTDGLLGIFNLYFICYMPCPFNSLLFDYPNNSELPKCQLT
jgi:hypothetical protein